MLQTVIGCVAAHYGFGKMHKDIKPTFNDAMMVGKMSTTRSSS